MMVKQSVIHNNILCLESVLKLHCGDAVKQANHCLTEWQLLFEILLIIVKMFSTIVSLTLWRFKH